VPCLRQAGAKPVMASEFLWPNILKAELKELVDVAWAIFKNIELYNEDW